MRGNLISWTPNDFGDYTWNFVSGHNEVGKGKDQTPYLLAGLCFFVFSLRHQKMHSVSEKEIFHWSET